jgi:ribosomal-protein-alanine N-acetyltransferase
MSVSESIYREATQLVVVSPMDEHDLLEVVEIEQQSGLSPWGWNAYHLELSSEHRNLMWVARLARTGLSSSREALAGYVVARLGAGELHINNLAVRESYRRQGIGRLLLSQILERARKAEAMAAFLEVRASNFTAQSFYERCGFRVVGRRRNYYPEPREDALIMRLDMSGEALI